METTRINRDIGRVDNGCGIAHLLSMTGRAQVVRLQEQLKAELGDGIWTMPPSSLHVTLCEIFQDKDYGEDKEALFARHKGQYDVAIRNALQDYKPIPILFDRVEASPDAIIIRGSDDGSINAIRSKLVTALPIPAETKAPPNIIHSSIARFVREVDFTKVQAIVAKFSVSFIEEVNEFQLIHNCSPHMLQYEVANQYSLPTA